MIENHNSFDFRKLWTNISNLNFLLRCKNPIFGPFLPKIGKIRIFLEKRAPSLFNPYWPLTHAKNQKNPMNGSWDIYIWKIEQSNWPSAFRSVTREPDFSQTCTFQRMIENHDRFDFRTLRTNISWLNFLLKCKNPIFGPFLAKIGTTRIFLKNRAQSLFNPYWPLTSCKKSEKSYDSIPRKSRTDGRKDGRHWIHKTWLSWVQKKKLNRVSLKYIFLG